MSAKIYFPRHRVQYCFTYRSTSKTVLSLKYFHISLNSDLTSPHPNINAWLWESLFYNAYTEHFFHKGTGICRYGKEIFLYEKCAKAPTRGKWVCCVDFFDAFWKIGLMLNQPLINGKTKLGLCSKKYNPFSEGFSVFEIAYAVQHKTTRKTICLRDQIGKNKWILV